MQHLYSHHPDLWNYLLALQKLPNKTTELFNRNYRFDAIDEIIRRDGSDGKSGGKEHLFGRIRKLVE